MNRPSQFGSSLPFIPFPAIDKHGVTGDRRTAALTAADGTLDWLCLPRYDGHIIFGALLDPEKGGFWRLGPQQRRQGTQRYLHQQAVLETEWDDGSSQLRLTDFLAWPHGQDAGKTSDRTVVIRRISCRQGRASCLLHLQPAKDFRQAAVTRSGEDLFVDAGRLRLRFWFDRPLQEDARFLQARFELSEGEEAWAVLAMDEPNDRWTAERCQDALHDTGAMWQRWVQRLQYSGGHSDAVLRSALTLHLLGYGGDGAQVAAATTSLPERIGGARNFDYRYAWIRDASLSVGMLSVLEDTATATRYLDWLTGLKSCTDAPLQVVYGITGELELKEREQGELLGYRGSSPVIFGNGAYRQRQLDGFGYLADCAWVYLQHGGSIHDDHWQLLERVAGYVASTWQEPDCSIWELTEADWVTGKVMAWVVLERMCQMAERTGRATDLPRWRKTMEVIRQEVLERGWSERMGAFRQRYGTETIDASALLIPIMGFLAADDPKVRATVERIEQELMCDGWVYRCVPSQTPSFESQPLGEAEGAFIPCTLMLATVYARQGQREKAEAILNNVDRAAGTLGLLAEEFDPRSGHLLGNTPLLFSHAEYIRAAEELNRSG